LFIENILLSSALRAETKIFQTPLDRIDAELSNGLIRESEAAFQKTYYLSADSRYDEERFGETGLDASNVYDCSSTVIQRSLSKFREKNRHFDPYGLLWRPWLEEADRISKQGEESYVGRVSTVPVWLYMPRGRLHANAAKYKSIRAELKYFLKKYNRSVASWAADVFGKNRIQAWKGPLLWPPDFLKDRAPYLGSYFDTHPVFDAGRTKRWRGPIETFLALVGVKAKSVQDEDSAEGSWKWIISDRVERNSLLWDPEGRSFLILSVKCLDRLIKGDWQHKDVWHKALHEMVIHEMMLAYYLNGKPKSFMRDPVMDAIIQGAAQSYLGRSGPIYTNGPFFRSMGHFYLSDEVHTDYWRYGSAPLWNYLNKLKGEGFLKKYLKSAKKPARYLEKALDEKNAQEDLRVAFAAWVLALEGTPRELRKEIPISVPQTGQINLQDIELKPIDPPKGSIGAAENSFRPQSFRLFHAPIMNAERVAGLNVRWEPASPQLSGYLFLAGRGSKGQTKFLDLAPIKPGSVQNVYFNPIQGPTELFFVVINRGQNGYPGEALQLQVSVVPKKKV
jgi:hypothetical protein